MRLDRYLSESGLGTRSEVKTLIKKKRICVNGVLISSDKFQLDPNLDQVMLLDRSAKTAADQLEGQIIRHETVFYYLMNKPAGLISATRDNFHQTVLDLLTDEDYRSDIFPVGRLDKDTEGLLLLSNDGALAHDLLSPHRHVEKEYFACVDGLATAETIAQFAAGVELIGEKGNPFKGELTIVAADEISQKSEIRLVIHRGVYHQVKRMFQALGMEVTYLKRLRMGNLALPDDLGKGAYRPLTAEEFENLSTLTQKKKS